MTLTNEEAQRAELRVAIDAIVAGLEGSRS